MGQTTTSLECMTMAIHQLYERAEQSGRKAYHLAHEQLENCRQQNDKDGVKFWRNVWIQLMSEEYKEPLEILAQRRDQQEA